MSDLQRSFAKAKLAKLPAEAPQSAFGALSEEDEEGYDDEDEVTPLPEPSPDDDSSSASSASSASSTGTIIPSPGKRLFARPNKVRRGLEPLPWNDYFSRELYLKNERQEETIIHHVYLTPPESKGPLIVAHHGAGSSGLTFALFTSEIRKLLPGCGVLSLDARGHGETVQTSRQDSSHALLDLSLSTLSRDLVDVVTLTKEAMAWDQLPGLVLVGHSLGGAVVTDVAFAGRLGSSVLGYAVLDVVEGSAMDALQSMQSYLSSRPKSFTTISSAIEWHTRSRTIRNSTSACISVPSLLQQAVTVENQSWTWRTDLAATQPFWEDWFRGLSKKFLEAKGGKLLMLAGTDRLDTALTIGQMQGKYQMQVLPEAGHFIQEDQAAKTAMIVADFYRRNDRSALVLPPKVGDLLKKK